MENAILSGDYVAEQRLSADRDVKHGLCAVAGDDGLIHREDCSNEGGSKHLWEILDEKGQALRP